MHAFSFSNTWTPGDKELLLLPFLDAETPCFSRQALPSALQTVAPPAEAGGTRVVHAGSIAEAFVLAQCVRLDAQALPPAENLKIAVAKAIEQARTEKLARVSVLLSATRGRTLPLAAQEGALLGAYVYDPYLSIKPERVLCETLLTDCGQAEQAALLHEAERAAMILEQVNVARDLCNAPPNEIHPQSLAVRLAAMARGSGMEVEIWNEADLERERCGGILAVGKGSHRSPRLVRAFWRPENARCHLALVGKGVTCDSGGYSLKPTESQVGMKYDMAGAATMFAAACAMVRRGLPLALSVYAPLVQNDISGAAFHVNDVITTRNGKTVEILNTDAEGRLLLADTLALACEERPDFLVDAATLTGAAVVGLGEDIAAVFGVDRAFTDLLLEAASETGESFWELPLHAPYAEKLKATIADVNNTGKTRMGGAILATLFLRNWVDTGVKWLHLDIAGPGGKEDPLGPLGKGGKGFGVRTLAALAGKLCRNQQLE